MDTAQITGSPSRTTSKKNRSERLEIYSNLQEVHLTGDLPFADKFKTYRFADYREQVIDLFMRVTAVSVETMKIVKEMPQ